MDTDQDTKDLDLLDEIDNMMEAQPIYLYTGPSAKVQWVGPNGESVGRRAMLR